MRLVEKKVWTSVLVYCLRASSVFFSSLFSKPGGIGKKPGEIGRPGEIGGPCEIGEQLAGEIGEKIKFHAT